MGKSSYFAAKTLCSATNTTSATVNYYLGMRGFKYAVIQCEIDGTLAVSVHASAQDDATADASKTYQDITSSFFGAATIGSTGMFVIDTPVSFGTIKVQVYSAPGAAGGTATIHAMRTN